MKKTTLLYVIVLFTAASAYGQFNYEPSKEFPFGRPNPKAPQQIKDYKALIGSCECKSQARKPDQTWAKPVNMIWNWKYIMNGMAVQDNTLKEDGFHSGSIRQYDKDSLRWNVHYYTTRRASSVLSVWNGNTNTEGNIVLYRNQKAPNGTEGFYRLTFYDISKKGYKWVGEWTDKTESVVFATWKIECVRKEN
ncbi:MAG: hypothetical protein JXR05_12925 [Flavobacteriaceae bacterium]